MPDQDRSMNQELPSAKSGVLGCKIRKIVTRGMLSDISEIFDFLDFSKRGSSISDISDIFEFIDFYPTK